LIVRWLGITNAVEIGNASRETSKGLRHEAATTPCPPYQPGPDEETSSIQPNRNAP
jgi:hypothetical protein